MTCFFFQTLFIFGCYDFPLLVGMPLVEFLRSHVIVSGGAPDCLNFDVKSLSYCNGHLWLVCIGSLWLVAFLTDL